jgi:hypothetical protein
MNESMGVSCEDWLIPKIFKHNFNILAIYIYREPVYAVAA